MRDRRWLQKWKPTSRDIRALDDFGKEVECVIEVIVDLNFRATSRQFPLFFFDIFWKIVGIELFKNNLFSPV